MRFGTTLRNGLVAGAAAGLASAAVMRVLVEPVIRRALAVEEARGHTGGHMEEPLVSRDLQVLVGSVTTVVVGALVGVVFAVVFARTRHRLPAGSDFGRAVVLACLGFGVFSLLPAVKLPANPPAVGDPATVEHRTLAYLLTILLGLLLVGAVWYLDGRLRPCLRPADRCAVDALAVVAGVALVVLVAPGSRDQIPADVPADLVWDFRLASLAQLATMWAALGVGFGLLATPRTAADRGLSPVSR